MKYAILCIGFSLLTACSQQPTTPVVPTTPEVVEHQVLEQVPSTLSIEHFGRMQLVGTGLTLDSILEENDAYTKYAISYVSNGLKITGVFLIPNHDGKHQLLIFNHGYIDPAVYTQGRGLKREEDYMARKGFAVLHPDYRGHAGSDKSPMTEQVYDGNLEYAMDSANAIYAVQAANLPNVDSTKVGMLGHSMGGGVTLAILTGRPELVDAAVLYAPVHSNVWENFMRWRAEREEGDRTIEQFGSFDEKPEVWKALSPDTFLHNIHSPILLFHGTSDNDVPYEWSDYLNGRLVELQRKISYITYPEEGHEFSVQWSDFMQKTSAFFQESLASAT